MRLRLLAAVMATTATLTIGALAAPAVAGAAPVAPRSQHVLNVDYQVQETGYWCGPAATRIALSARGINVSQADMAAQLGTTTNGTDWIGQVTGVLSNHVGWYETKEMPNDPPTQAPARPAVERHRARHQQRLRDRREHRRPGGQPPAGLPGLHDLPLLHGDRLRRLEHDRLHRRPGVVQGNQFYWLSFDQLATLIPPKGYSA